MSINICPEETVTFVTIKAPLGTCSFYGKCFYDEKYLFEHLLPNGFPFIQNCCLEYILLYMSWKQSDVGMCWI